MNEFALARARVKNFRFKPNQAELKLLELLDESFPNKWIFNGGQIQIEGLIPDFLHIGPKKLLLEYIGRKDFPKHSPEALKTREKTFNKYGFNVMFLRDTDLKDTNQLFLDILFFTHYNLKEESYDRP